MCAICDFKVDFQIDHPQALTVAVATRAAIDAGMLPGSVFDGALAQAKLRMAAIDTLKVLQFRLEQATPIGELMALPDFYVLLIEGGTWGFFHATEAGFDPDGDPQLPNVTADDPAARDIVLVATSAVLQSIFDGKHSLQAALAAKLLLLDATPAHAAQLHAMFAAALQHEKLAA